jgi:phosphoribosyl 1,2-cyclic phosphate phosphodiesterase
MSEMIFLGTGAADWNLAMKNEGFFRRNSSCLIDKKLLIDPGAHIFSFIEDFNVPDLFDELTDIIVTHFHSDHINKESVLRLAENRSLRVGCDKRTMEHIGEHPNITYTLFKPYIEYNVGDMIVTPLLANHDIVADGENFAFNYYIETKDGKSIFYGLDSAWILRPTWEYLKKKKFDAFIFDCTVGDKDDWRIFEHNTIPMIRKMVEEINAKELMKEGGKLIASHMARTLHKSHEDTAEILEKINMITAFDGMKVQL